MNRRIAAALTTTLKLYPSAKVTEDAVIAYCDYLNDLPEDVVIRAIEECAKTGTFFPALAEIRNRVIAIIGESVIVDPEAAWGAVRREARRVGFNRPPIWHNGTMHDAPTPEFGSPMVAQAVEAIGWRDICLVDDDDVPTIRAQFRDALRAIQRREVDRIVSGRHLHTPEISNGRAGNVLSITSIGNPIVR